MKEWQKAVRETASKHSTAHDEVWYYAKSSMEQPRHGRDIIHKMQHVLSRYAVDPQPNDCIDQMVKDAVYYSARRSVWDAVVHAPKRTRK